MNDFSYILDREELKVYFERLAATESGREIIKSKEGHILIYINDYMEQVHQYAFYHIREVIKNNPTITESQLKQELINLEKKYIEGCTESVMGIENEARMARFAHDVYRYSKNKGFIVDAANYYDETKVDFNKIEKHQESIFTKIKQEKCLEEKVKSIVKNYLKSLVEE